MKPMSNGDKAVVLFNRGTTTFHMSVTMRELGLAAGRHVARDLWAHANRTVNNEIAVLLEGHSVAMFIVRK